MTYETKEKQAAAPALNTVSTTNEIPEAINTLAETISDLVEAAALLVNTIEPILSEQAEPSHSWEEPKRNAQLTRSIDLQTGRLSDLKQMLLGITRRVEL